jgi:hypothetical protein
MIHVGLNSQACTVIIPFITRVGHSLAFSTDLECLPSSEEPFPSLLKMDGRWFFQNSDTYLPNYRVSKKSGTNGNFIYYLHYMLYMFTPTLYAFSQLLYHVCADFTLHIAIDSSTTVCNSLLKVTKISDFNSIHHP